MTTDNQQPSTYNFRRFALWSGVVRRLLPGAGYQRTRRALPGFTLIETFVAIIILVTSLAGALALSSSGFNSADVAGDQVTAAFLAQDAIEYVRAERDTARLQQNADWLALLAPCVSSDTQDVKYCEFDSAGNNPKLPKPCPVSPPNAGSNTGYCDPLYFDTSMSASSFFYNYNAAGTPTKFVRAVRIVTHQNASSQTNEATVTVFVSWLGRNGRVQGPITLQEELYNWQ